MKRIVDYIVYLLLSIIGLFSMLFPRRMALLLGKWFGDLLFLIPNKRKGMAINNVMKTLGMSRKEAVDTIRELYENLVMNIVDFLRFPMMFRRKRLFSIVDFVGKERLDSALSKGKGVILVTGHYGNWEMLVALAVAGYPVYAIVREQSNRYVDRLVNRYRKMSGIGLILKKEIMKDVVSVLRHGNMVVFLSDQDGGDTGVILPFLGIKASCVKGPVAMALLTQSPIVPVFAVRNGWGYTIYIEKEIPVEKYPDRAKTYSVNIARINDIIEKYIRLHPGQWFWLHDRWKL